MNTLGLRGQAEQSGDGSEAFLLGFFGKGAIFLVRLALAREGFLQVFMSAWHGDLLCGGVDRVVDEGALRDGSVSVAWCVP